MFQIDHLGIAVKSLAAAKSIYEKLGLSVSPVETVEQEKVRLVMVPVGESRLELLEATSEVHCRARRGVAPCLYARSRSRGRGCEIEERRRAPGVE